jgi:tRNA(Ile)-lysidine synthase
MLAPIMRGQIIKEENEIILPIKVVSSLHPFLLPFLFRESIEELTGSLKGITYRHLQQLVKLINSSTGTQLHLPCGYIAKKAYEEVIIKRKSSITQIIPEPVEINLPGVHILPGWRMMVNSYITDSIQLDMKSDPYSLYLDADKIGPGTFRFRTRKDGDRFQPFGMEGTKKLKEFFIDEKIPRDKRDLIPLLEKNDNILWILGIRPSDVYKVDSFTKKILIVRAEYLEGDIYV